MATSISANGATQYVSLRMNAGLVEYSTDQSTYMPIAATANWPVTITNANPGASSILRVVATQNLTITGGYGNTSGYLIAGSTYITFDGSGNTITLDGITGYPGFIRNGTSGASGRANIIVQNFTTAMLNSATLSNSGGWLCQAYFGRGVSGNSIINCTNSSTGLINIESAGGIAGRSAGSFSGGSITFTNCTNNAVISSTYSGGIAGRYGGSTGATSSLGSITFNNCSNTGAISGSNVGGISGGNSGSDGSTATFIGCSNSGAFTAGSNTGGIAGSASGVGTGGRVFFTSCTNSANISIDNSGGIAADYCGAFGGSATFTDCTNSGNISGTGSGGISSIVPGGAGGNAIFTRCTNTGAISAQNAGGIAAGAAGVNGSATFTDCTNSGTITGQGVGGIVGSDAGNSNGTLTCTGCTNSGNINASNAGGITGSNAGRSNGSVIITNCTNSGNIDGSSESAGGIAGSYLVTTNGTASITGCSSTGTISALESGGIVGQNAGYIGGLCNITSCFSTGAITGRSSGGITGNQFADNTNQPCTITQCYSTGAISGPNAGGIAGGNVGFNNNGTNPVVNITNSYSLGAIATSCGGICGGAFSGSTTYTNPATINITNCYSFGLLSGTGQGLVAANLTSPNINLIATNTYVANNNWRDASANVALTGTPTGVGLANKGATWTSYPSANTTYLLSSYLPLTGAPQLYTPNSVIAYTNYTSSGGFYTSGTYSIASSSQVDNIITLNVIRAASTSPYNGYYSGTFALTNMNGNYTGGIVATINSSSGVLRFVLPNLPCFLEGTKILCFENNQEVYRPIENLRKGDLVKTIYNGYVPINMMGTKSIYNPGNDYRVVNRLYKCSREKYPTLFEDLYITGCHSILVPEMTDDQWENTKAVNGTIFVTDNHFRLIACADEKAEPFNKEGFMNIYHIAVEHHDTLMNYGIYANGLLVESCSERNLRELSNMRILGEEDCAVSENADKVPFNMDRELVEIY